MRSHITARVNEALKDAYAEDGLTKFLKPLVIEGYRGEVTDALINVLEDQSRPESDRVNAEEILYYLHGTEAAMFFPRMGCDPRPENARQDERLTNNQLERIVDASLRETNPQLLGVFASLLDVLASTLPFPAICTEKTKRFITRCMTIGDSYAVDRSKSLSAHLQGH